MRSKQHILFFLTIFMVIAADQFTKHLVLQGIPLYKTVPLINGFFNLTHVTNTGAAFGFLAGHEAWRYLFFLGIGGMSVLAMLIFYFKAGPHPLAVTLGLAMVSGGALGNVWDRVQLGFVVDFLDFYLGNYHWPAFNVADSAITVGGGIMAWSLIMSSGKDVSSCSSCKP
ncbi:MAG: signal peptidase II [Deltaproteobacteria bacterium]|nr:signal peptidase II [Deltaproteobacteria bacterium]